MYEAVEWSSILVRAVDARADGGTAAKRVTGPFVEGSNEWTKNEPSIMEAGRCQSIKHYGRPIKVWN